MIVPKHPGTFALALASSQCRPPQRELLVLVGSTNPEMSAFHFGSSVGSGGSRVAEDVKVGNLTAGSPSVRDRNIWLQTVLCKTPLLSLLHGFLSTELLPKDGHVSQRTLGHPLVSHVCAVGSSSLEAESRLLVCTISGQLMSPPLEPGQGSAAVPSGAWPGESHVCVEGPCSDVHPAGRLLPVVLELSPRGYTTGTHCPLERGQAVAAGRHQRKAAVLGLPPSLYTEPLPLF